jgi:hypothetical protein
MENKKIVGELYDPPPKKYKKIEENNRESALITLMFV